jgi:alanyl-tRNA synthetase
VTRYDDDRGRDDVRRFVIQCLAHGAPWVVAGAGAPDPVVMVGRAKSGGLDLRTLVPALCERAGRKGGGSPDLVQTAAADAPSAKSAFDWVVAELESKKL